MTIYAVTLTKTAISKESIGEKWRGGGGDGTDRVVLDIPSEKEELAQMVENLELCTERNR